MTGWDAKGRFGLHPIPRHSRVQEHGPGPGARPGSRDTAGVQARGAAPELPVASNVQVEFHRVGYRGGGYPART